MKNPIKDKICKLEAIGQELNDVEADLKRAMDNSKKAASLFYAYGFNAENERILILRTRLGTLRRDYGLFVDAALAELRLKREELKLIDNDNAIIPQR